VIPRTPDIGLPASSLATPENLTKRGTCTEAELVSEFDGEVWAVAETTRARKLSATAQQELSFIGGFSFKASIVLTKR
jgi:hypothetical protein